MRRLEPVLDVVLARQRYRTSKRNRGFPGQSAGPASQCRQLAGDALKIRACELGASVTANDDREVSHQKENASVGQPRSRPQRVPDWERKRIAWQARLFRINDRPELDA